MNYYYKKKRKSALSYTADIGIGILFTVLLISIGLILAINLRFLYYADIKWFDLEQSSGLPYQVIKENYNALIDYCSPFFKGSLVFPSLAASTSGISHFAEVKTIFNIFYIMFAVITVLLIIIVALKHKKGQYQYLRTASITSIVLPLITLIACSINFNATFKLMHKVLFRNNDWLFDPNTDPIILLLPEKFFLQCALIIIATVLLGSLILHLIYSHLKKKNKEVPLIQPKVNYYY
ncbi:MAG: TIGR01906 family membrane protein [Clostridiales bacterium]|nr:TIGR01906 family membrane protein [Clostridiales bacterium]